MPNKENTAPERNVRGFWNFETPDVIRTMVPPIVNGRGKTFAFKVLLTVVLPPPPLPPPFEMQ
jgi:hypothetical protein